MHCIGPYDKLTTVGVLVSVLVSMVSMADYCGRAGTRKSQTG